MYYVIHKRTKQKLIEFKDISNYIVKIKIELNHHLKTTLNTT